MYIFICRRLVQTVFVLFGVALVTFLILRVLPGDPEEQLGAQQLSEQARAALRANWRLDRPLAVQLGHYLMGLPVFDFGDSFFQERPVRAILLGRQGKLWISAKLALGAMLFATALGIAAGLVSAILKNSWLDRLATVCSLLGISTPVFFAGMLLILIFAQFSWPWLSGYGGGRLQYLILPVLALGMRSVAYLQRMTRSAALEIMRADFLTTARAKGLSEWRVIGKHLLRNALIPIVTVIGLDLANYMSGTVLTEKVFNYPGMGTEMLEAILRRDAPLVMGCVILMTGIFVLANLLTDLLYAVIDPRIRLSAGAAS